MIKITRGHDEEHRSVRITFMWLFNFEVGVHSINGYHLSTGIGVGPCEVSMSLHNWEKW